MEHVKLLWPQWLKQVKRIPGVKTPMQLNWKLINQEPVTIEKDHWISNKCQ